jgi:hypothetical protein
MMSATNAVPHGDTASPLLARARSEFVEMPGLRLTSKQAARLWAIDGATSERILNHLVDAGFLGRRRDGAYLRASAF